MLSHPVDDDHPSAPGQLVLLVEDERSIAEPFAEALRRSGFRTTVASTGRDAIALAASCRPDVILLDLALPDLDGRDVCRHLRRGSSVPIIMVTASGTVTDRVVGLELGADDYVVKPFATGEVIARIRAVLRRGRHRSDAGVVAVFHRLAGATEREIKQGERPVGEANDERRAARGGQLERLVGVVARALLVAAQRVEGREVGQVPARAPALERQTEDPGRPAGDDADLGRAGSERPGIKPRSGDHPHQPLTLRVTELLER
jgi:DNA-binding response OmpR family regulator